MNEMKTYSIIKAVVIGTIIAILLSLIFMPRIMNAVEEKMTEEMIVEGFRCNPEMNLIYCDLEDGVVIYEYEGMIYEYGNCTTDTIMMPESWTVEVYKIENDNIMETMIQDCLREN